jgi:nicotinamidase-related amidase
VVASADLRAEGGEVTTALLVVDMLEDFVSGRLANPAALPTLDPIGRLIHQARDRQDWIVVYGNDAHRPGDAELSLFGEHAMAGTPGAAVVEPLAPAPSDVVVPKRFYSAFTQTDLLATCQVERVSRLVVVGQHTDCCVRHTAYDAYLAGIPLTVVADGTCVYRPGSPEPAERRQERALDYLRTYYGAEVLTAAEVCR